MYEVLALCVNPFTLPRWSPVIDRHLVWYTDRQITDLCETLFFIIKPTRWTNFTNYFGM